MASYTTKIETAASTEQVLAVLTDPNSIRSWSPVPFDVAGLDDDVLKTGSEARVNGNLAGLRVGFDVRVHAADARGLRLSADGPVALDVAYGLRSVANGSELRASVSLGRPRGLTARVVGKATEALLSAGALEGATSRIAAAAEAVAPSPLPV